MRKTFAVAVWLSLVCVAQTQTHTFCPTDAACTWTGAQTLNIPIIGNYTVATLPTPHTYQQAFISDGASSNDCTVGGGSSKVLCYYNGSAWTASSNGGAPSGNAGGSLTGTFPNPTFDPGVSNTWTAAQTAPFIDKGGTVYNAAAYGYDINATITAAGEGNTVFLPAHTYVITSSIKPKRGQTITCSGSSVTGAYGAVIQPASGSAIYAFEPASPSDNIYSVTVNGCTIDLTHDSAALGGIHQTGQSWWTWNSPTVIMPNTGSMNCFWGDGTSPGAYYTTVHDLKCYENPLTNWAQLNTHKCIYLTGSSFGGANGFYFSGGSCNGIDTGWDILFANQVTIDHFTVDGYGTHCGIIEDNTLNRNTGNIIQSSRCETYTPSLVGKINPTMFYIGTGARNNFLDYPLFYSGYPGVTPFTEAEPGKNMILGVLNHNISDYLLTRFGGSTTHNVQVNMLADPTHTFEVGGTAYVNGNFTTDGLNPVFGSNAADSPINIDIKAGLTTDQTEAFRFCTHTPGVCNYFLEAVGSTYIGIYDRVDSLQKFQSFTGGSTLLRSSAGQTVQIFGHPVYWGDTDGVAKGSLSFDGSILLNLASGNYTKFTSTPTGQNVITAADTAGVARTLAYTSQLPPAQTSTANQWIKTFVPSSGQSDAGSWTTTQPAFTDISGTATVAQLPAGSCYTIASSDTIPFVLNGAGTGETEVAKYHLPALTANAKVYTTGSMIFGATGNTGTLTVKDYIGASQLLSTAAISRANAYYAIDYGFDNIGSASSQSAWNRGANSGSSQSGAVNFGYTAATGTAKDFLIKFTPTVSADTWTWYAPTITVCNGN